jgi:hypothetical protein
MAQSFVLSNPSRTASRRFLLPASRRESLDGVGEVEIDNVKTY